MTVTADAKTKVYGDADPALTYQSRAAALAFSDAFSGALTRAAGENVGSLRDQPGHAERAAATTTLTFVGANLTITKATLTVTADNKSRQYGDSNPSLTATFAGLQVWRIAGNQRRCRERRR